MKENKTQFSGVKVEQPASLSTPADVGTTIDQSQLAIRGIQPDYFTHLPGSAFVSPESDRQNLDYFDSEPPAHTHGRICWAHSYGYRRNYTFTMILFVTLYLFWFTSWPVDGRINTSQIIREHFHAQTPQFDTITSTQIALSLLLRFWCEIKGSLRLSRLTFNIES